MKFNPKPLIRARRLKRWTRERLAVEIGKSPDMIYKVERGLRASERTIFAMSEKLGVPMEKLLIKGEDDAA